MVKIGVVGVPGGWSSERLADAVFEKTGFRLLIDMKDVYFDSEKKSVFYHNVNLASLDAIVVKKIGPRYDPDFIERIQLLIYLKNKGLAIFSNPEAILKSFDRLSCTLQLQSHDIPMPPTYVTEDLKKAVEIVHKYNKAVFKPLYSSKARGMIVLDSSDKDLEQRIAAFQADHSVMYIQKFIDMPGKDLAVTFIGGEYLTTYARVATNKSWNTTTVSGGKYEAHSPSDEIIDLADRAQKIFGLTFTSVDIVETESGPMVFEVSAFGGFRGLLNAYDIDAASIFVDEVLMDLKERTYSKKRYK